MPDALIDTIQGGAGGVRYNGSVAQQLAANNFNVNALRSNSVLRKEEWNLLDTQLVQIARSRLKVVDALLSAGLSFPITNGLGTTTLQWEEQSDMEDAQLSMDAVTRGQKDRLAFDINTLPLPIVHADFHISIRNLESSRRLGTPLDTATMTTAMRKVAEKVETIVINGASSLAMGGGTLYGMLDFPGRNTASLVSGNWDASGKTGVEIMDDVQLLIAASHADNMFGPYGLFVPTTWWTVLSEDYSTQYARTIFNRLSEIPNLSFIQVADFLPANEAVMLQLDPSVMDIVVGMQPRVVSWESEGGMMLNFKVMTIMVPRPKVDYEGRSGIVHLS